MAMHHSVRSLVCALSAVGLLVVAPAAFGAAAHDAVPTCGDDKGKDTKKPKPDDEKRPANPASYEQLCGGDKGGKDTKKPKPDDDQDKRPAPNPA
jgi:hypothetical protein